ncbi:MAG: hypothetical protein ACREFW_05285 [Rhizomicrobium sp.]
MTNPDSRPSFIGPLWGFAAGIAAALASRPFPRTFEGLVDLFPPLVLLLVWLVFWRVPSKVEAAAEFRHHHRIALAFILAAALAFGFFYMREAQPSVYDAICLAFFPLAAGAVIAYGAGSLGPVPVRPDELARAFRARASRAGYLVVMAMLGVVYFAMVYEPKLVPMLLGSALFLGVGVPSATFFALEWQARSHGHEKTGP